MSAGRFASGAVRVMGSASRCRRAAAVGDDGGGGGDGGSGGGDDGGACGVLWGVDCYWCRRG